MDEAELRELAEDLEKNGLLEPIVLCDEQILDGRNRSLACPMAGIAPRFERPTIVSPVSYVLSKNLHRRHLTTSQRAAIAAEVVPLLREEARKRQEATRAKPGEQVGHRPCRNLQGVESDSRHSGGSEIKNPRWVFEPI